jgi:hypothetical protein
MSKRTSYGDTLEQMKHIGRLIYSSKHFLGRGSYGSVYKGKLVQDFGEEIDVAIKRIEKQNVSEFEKVIMDNIEPHPNILQHHCIQEDEDFM